MEFKRPAASIEYQQTAEQPMWFVRTTVRKPNADSDLPSRWPIPPPHAWLIHAS